MGITKDQKEIKKLTTQNRELREMTNAAHAATRNLQMALGKTNQELAGFHRATDVKKSYCEHLAKAYGPDWAKNTTHSEFLLGLGLFVAGVNYKTDANKIQNEAKEATNG